MMRVRLGMSAVLAGVMAVSISAQTPPPSGSQSAAMDEQKKITVTGCLERATERETPTGTSGTAATGAAAKFVLNNVTSAPSAPGTAGTSGSARATASSYRLDAEDSKLAPHVGHKVEITGTVDTQASATGATASAGAPKLKVDAVKMVAASCTP